MVPSCYFLAPYDVGTPNLLAKLQSDLSSALACGIVMFVWYRHLGVELPCHFLALDGAWTLNLLAKL